MMEQVGTEGPHWEDPESEEGEVMTKERKVDDTELEEVAGAGEQIVDFQQNEDGDDGPPPGGIDRPTEPPEEGSQVGG
jgi:hypothetical protein